MKLKLLHNQFREFVVKHVESFIGRICPYGNPAYFDNADFPWTQEIENEYPKILAEYHALIEAQEDIRPIHEFSHEQFELSRDGRWKSFFLYAYGYQLKKNCDKCPQTDLALKKIPGMKTAFFSILDSGKTLKTHRGFYKGILRYHMGIVVPDPFGSCFIKVNNQLAFWEEGKSLIFDDSFDHTVSNDADSERVVLFVDMVRPLPFWFAWINRLMIFWIGKSEYIQTGWKKYKEQNQ